MIEELSPDDKLRAVKFCNELLANGKNRTQAYLFITKDKDGKDTVTENTASTEGSKLLAIPWVSAYYNRVVEEAIAQEIIKPARILKRLDDIAEQSYAANDFFTTIRASDSLSRALYGTTGKGVKSITSNPDGTVKILFENNLNENNQDTPKEIL